MASVHQIDDRRIAAFTVFHRFLDKAELIDIFCQVPIAASGDPRIGTASDAPS
ncbi:hypothetical protein RFM68_06580 [Mesorhizobium sp. MSK_1335]|uniref:Uncharacterized protein n=1 Tax=Mesorhizobium montanum TaxID=3072323 RepID=A0ABU4ZFN0_9HYPH|nr:hypothetical protein [Mesorhizobium sp. MSK_1335]MDX8524164.1 hypothetical protein [Mesorhizobium sp. MSK_1335]